MRTRDAILPDAEKIHDLISSYSGDGTLLPRNFAEICENVRDFVVLEHRGKIVGCGALHLYGQHLAEIRSITVDPKFQRQGGGKRLVQALMEEAEKHAGDLHLPIHSQAGNSSLTWVLANPSAKICQTKSTKTATSAHACIAATKSRW